MSRKQQLTITGILFLVLAAVIGAFGWVVRDWALKVASEPHTISAGRLAASGPGENHFICLNDYELGEPILEQGPNVNYAWFPVFAKGRARPKTPPIIFRPPAVANPSELERLKTSPPAIEGIVGNGITGMLQQPSREVTAAFPDIESASVWYVQAQEGPFRLVALGAWGLAGASLLVGAVALALGLLAPAERREEARAAKGRAEETIPVSTAAVQRYRSTKNSVPNEILALGTPEQVHCPQRFLAFAKERPATAALLGAAIALTGLVLPGLLGLQGYLAAVSIGIAFLGVLYALIPFTQLELPTWIVYPDALVIVTGDDYAVIRWQALRELNDVELVTADGQKFVILLTLRDRGTLYNKVKARVRERLLPPALETLERGEAVTIGPCQVSVKSVTNQGRTVPWTHVSKMVISSHLQYGHRKLTIWRHDPGGVFCNVDLNKIPNDWLLIELITRVAPKHLLESRR